MPVSGPYIRAPWRSSPGPVAQRFQSWELPSHTSHVQSRPTSTLWSGGMSGSSERQDCEVPPTLKPSPTSGLMYTSSCACCERGQNVRSAVVEDWARRVVGTLAGQRNEDSRVELKREWPNDPNRAARRIAGLCNAWAGERVMWIVGLDEGDRQTHSVANEMAEWWPRVVGEFHQGAPRCRSRLRSTGKASLVALVFETDQAPFVTRNPRFGLPDGGPVELEVPWREGTSVRMHVGGICYDCSSTRSMRRRWSCWMAAAIWRSVTRATRSTV